MTIAAVISSQRFFSVVVKCWPELTSNTITLLFMIEDAVYLFCIIVILRAICIGVNFLQIVGAHGPFLPLPSPPLSFPPLPSPPFPLPLLPSPLLPSPLLRSRAPQIQPRGLGERCKLPQRGLGRSPMSSTSTLAVGLYREKP